LGEFSSFREFICKIIILYQIFFFSKQSPEIENKFKKIAMFLHIVQASSQDIK
jgi:hypothetical protein